MPGIDQTPNVATPGQGAKGGSGLLPSIGGPAHYDIKTAQPAHNILKHNHSWSTLTASDLKLTNGHNKNTGQKSISPQFINPLWTESLAIRWCGGDW